MAKRRESQIAAVSQAMTQDHYDVLLFLILVKKGQVFVCLFYYWEQRFLSRAEAYPNRESADMDNNKQPG